jgi:hypothetical protein
MYFWNYIDRGALAQARLNNLERDLGMVGDNFNTAVSILTVGYVLMQIPSNMLLTRVRPSSYLSGFALIWSIISSMFWSCLFNHFVAHPLTFAQPALG